MEQLFTQGMIDAATTRSTLTLADLERAIAAMPEEPIGEWMRSHDAPPETHTVFLPERFRMAGGSTTWPPYVRFQCYMPEVAIFVRNELAPQPSDPLRGRRWAGLWPPSVP